MTLRAYAAAERRDHSGGIWFWASAAASGGAALSRNLMDRRTLATVRLSPRAYQRITLFALVALCVIIVSGGAVRLTGSGLGCPDWPNCDSTTPVHELGYHAWVEYGNRLFTGLVSIAV